MEEAQRMRLDELAAMCDFAQQLRGLGNSHGHDGVAGFRRRELVTDGADAADARRDSRHLVKRLSGRRRLTASYSVPVSFSLFQFEAELCETGHAGR